MVGNNHHEMGKTEVDKSNKFKKGSSGNRMFLNTIKHRQNYVLHCSDNGFRFRISIVSRQYCTLVLFSLFKDVVNVFMLRL